MCNMTLKVSQISELETVNDDNKDRKTSVKQNYWEWSGTAQFSDKGKTD